ncbi:pyridine nucleotide-disulfide oxidoreductase family protein [Actinidia rufa]|uniref:Pyridine nucleotide-disulfide oxidoreductase family protein n=1 Tax=Actinidia rufa TaxID=165716 RepID=A0A7J0GAD1_9ERIC|nr:pyridine nucleotide-disulfide oxidoreductase family protein [Actinidia rufa]
MASSPCKTLIGLRQTSSERQHRRISLPKSISTPTTTTLRRLRIMAAKSNTKITGRNLRVAIVGGGPAGGSAAETLAKGGIETYLIERKMDNCKPCGGAIPLCMVGEFDLPLDIIDRRVTRMKMISPSNVAVDIGRTLKPNEYVGMVRREILDAYLRDRAAAAGATVINGLFLKNGHAEAVRFGSGFALRPPLHGLRREDLRRRRAADAGSRRGDRRRWGQLARGERHKRRRLRVRNRVPGADQNPRKQDEVLRGSGGGVRRRRRVAGFLRLGFPQMRPRSGGHGDGDAQIGHQKIPDRDEEQSEGEDFGGEDTTGGGAPDTGAPTAAKGGGEGGAGGGRGGVRDQVFRGGDLFRGEERPDVRGGDRGGVGERAADGVTLVYRSNPAREAFVEMCADEYVQKMTFDSYLYKRVVPGNPLDDLKLAVNTIGSLVRAHALNREMEKSN